MQLRSSQEAIDLIISFEVTSEAVYQKDYQRPVWPGGQSGVTIGIGYDCGYARADEIAAHWGDKLHPAILRALEGAAGVTGSPAHALAHELHGIVVVPWSAAIAVFSARDMPKWESILSHALPNTDKLSGDSFGALNSLTYNRGPSYSAPGSRYAEMRGIKALMGAQQFERIPDEIREMKRLWPIVPGLQIRRDKEADLFERGLSSRSN